MRFLAIVVGFVGVMGLGGCGDDDGAGFDGAFLDGAVDGSSSDTTAGVDGAQACSDPDTCPAGYNVCCTAGGDATECLPEFDDCGGLALCDEGPDCPGGACCPQGFCAEAGCD